MKKANTTDATYSRGKEELIYLLVEVLSVVGRKRRKDLRDGARLRKEKAIKLFSCLSNIARFNSFEDHVS